MTTLENLYYGNIDPANKYIKRGSEYSKLLNLLMRNEEKLKYNCVFDGVLSIITTIEKAEHVAHIYP